MARFTQQEYNAFLARNRKPLPPSEGVSKEAELHEAILNEVRRRGWISFHSRMDKPSTATIGQPDFVILSDGGRVILVECKTKTGKLRPEQAALHAWAAKLGYEVHVIRSLEDFISIL